MLKKHNNLRYVFTLRRKYKHIPEIGQSTHITILPKFEIGITTGGTSKMYMYSIQIGWLFWELHWTFGKIYIPKN